jgi:hypothetical protein
MKKAVLSVAIALGCLIFTADTGQAESSKLSPPLVIEEEGSLSAGAQVLKDPGGMEPSFITITCIQISRFPKALVSYR